MVLLPPLVYLGSRAVDLPLVLALGRASLSRAGLRSAARSIGAAAVAWLRAAGARRAARPARGARRARSRSTQYDAFANWALKAKLLYFDRSFANASIAPPVHREYPLGLPSLEAYRASRDRQREHARRCTCCSCVLPRRARARRVARAASARRDVAARRRAEPAALDAGGARSGAHGATRTFRSRVCSSAPSCSSAAASSRSARSSPRRRWRRSATRSRSVAVLYAVSFAAVLVRRERDRLAPLAISAFCVALSAVPWRVYDAVHDLRDHDVVAVAVARRTSCGFVLHRDRRTSSSRSAYLWALPLARGRGARDARARARPAASRSRVLALELGARRGARRRLRERHDRRALPRALDGGAHAADADVARGAAAAAARHACARSRSAWQRARARDRTPPRWLRSRRRRGRRRR